MLRSTSESSLEKSLGDDQVPEPLPISRATTSSSVSSTSSSTSTPTASPPSSIKGENCRHLLRQRTRDNNWDVFEIEPAPLPDEPMPLGESRLGSLLLGPHHFDPNPPLLPRVRKKSDFDVHKELPPRENEERMGTVVRTREQFVLHFLMELTMLRRDAILILTGTVFQWVHSVFTNIAYYYHAQLTAAQRVPLQDVMFDALPKLDGSWWIASEFLVYGIIVTTVAAIASILFVRWAAPHGRPLYCIPILRRMLMTLVVCQSLRIISFLITTLPGASRQCLYDVPEDMTRDEMISGPAHERGNPEGWMPPTTWGDILWRVDATNGCGDLMFSSHTIFTMTFLCLTFTYFNWKYLKGLMVTCQILLVPFILAAHKHYSVDVFTALYVTPLVYETLKRYFPDRDVKSADMARHYGLRFYLARGASSYVVAMWGKEFYVEPEDLPIDLQEVHFGKSKRTPRGGGGGPLTLAVSGDATLSEVDPMIV